jgi:nitronate monooxygenase
VFSFTFNIPPADVLRAFRAASTYLMGTATTVAEARALVDAGVDAIVAQGSEAGGHRGTFGGPFEAAMVGTMALLPQIVDAVDVPVVAAGGIMDGRGIVAARALGAAGAQLGTAFLTCRESGLPQAYKDAVRGSSDDATMVTRAWSGRPLRVLRNRFVEALGDRSVPAYPVQNALTRPLRAAAAARGETGLMGLLAGQAGRLARDLSATDLVHQLVGEAESVAVAVQRGVQTGSTQSRR